MQLRSLITVGLAVAAIAVLAAQAGAQKPLGHRGSQPPVSNPYLARISEPGGVGLVSAKPRLLNSYLKRIHEPGGVALVQVASTPSAETGFAWDDTAMGAGFTAGLGLIAAAAWLATRRRTTPAHSSS